MEIARKFFILGLPGSGKSAMARFISSYVSDYRWTVHRLNDYTILDNMFRLDIAWKRFKPAESGGFDVIKLEVFDEALQTLERAAEADLNLLDMDEKKLVIIEFSRNNYRNAFQQFSSSFLKDAYFLYLHADVEVCKQRIRHRIANPQFLEDDFNVSDYIFENYYNGDDGVDITKILAEYGVDRTHVKVMENHHSYEEACMEAESYVKRISDSTTQEGSDKVEKSLKESVPDKCAEDKEWTSRKEQVIINEEKYVGARS